MILTLLASALIALTILQFGFQNADSTRKQFLLAFENESNVAKPYSFVINETSFSEHNVISEAIQPIEKIQPHEKPLEIPIEQPSELPLQDIQQEAREEVNILESIDKLNTKQEELIVNKSAETQQFTQDKHMEKEKTQSETQPETQPETLHNETLNIPETIVKSQESSHQQSSFLGKFYRLFGISTNERFDKNSHKSLNEEEEKSLSDEENRREDEKRMIEEEKKHELLEKKQHTEKQKELERKRIEAKRKEFERFQEEQERMKAEEYKLKQMYFGQSQKDLEHKFHQRKQLERQTLSQSDIGTKDYQRIEEERLKSIQEAETSLRQAKEIAQSIEKQRREQEALLIQRQRIEQNARAELENDQKEGKLYKQYLNANNEPINSRFVSLAFVSFFSSFAVLSAVIIILRLKTEFDISVF